MPKVRTVSIEVLLDRAYTSDSFNIRVNVSDFFEGPCVVVNDMSEWLPYSPEPTESDTSATRELLAIQISTQKLGISPKDFRKRMLSFQCVLSLRLHTRLSDALIGLMSIELLLPAALM